MPCQLLQGVEPDKRTQHENHLLLNKTLDNNPSIALTKKVEKLSLKVHSLNIQLLLTTTPILRDLVKIQAQGCSVWVARVHTRSF